MTTETNKVLSHFSATPEIPAFALECANDAVYIYDDNRRIYYSNPRVSQMTGYTPAELACMSVADIDPTYSFPDRATVLERARLGTRVLIETIHRLRDGTEFPVEVSQSVAMFAGRIKTIAFVRDISRRRTRQREKEQFRQIIDTSPVALLICERDAGIIRYTNFFAQRLFDGLKPHSFDNTLELLLQFANQSVWVSLNSRNLLLDGRESVCLAMMDVTEAHELSNQLSYQATYDDLTGLLNRREFEDRLQEVIELACERRSDNMLCYLDLDQFKVINDSCGHMAGDEMLRRADAGCYAARESGRNRLQIFHPSDAELNHRHHEMQWVSRLNAALESSRFELWFQEIAEINHAAETVSHSAGCHFEMMIRRLFAWFAANPEARKKVSLCAINVSGQTLNHRNFQHAVITMLESAQLPAECLCFEVTETSAIANLAATPVFMQRLRQYGCRFALDDFGRGLSSFAYLKSLPVDFVKIDGYFVKDILTDPVDRAMVKAIIDMAQALGKKTIAEFVENEAILEQLIELNVDYVQGCGIARPQPLC